MRLARENMEILVWDGSAESLDRNSQDVENIAGILQGVGREGEGVLMTCLFGGAWCAH